MKTKNKTCLLATTAFPHPANYLCFMFLSVKSLDYLGFLQIALKGNRTDRLQWVFSLPLGQQARKETSPAFQQKGVSLKNCFNVQP